MVAVAGLGSIHYFSSSVPKLSRKLVDGQRDKVRCFPSAISEPENSSTYICRWLGPRLVGCGLRLPIRKSRKVNLCSYSGGETAGGVLKLQEFKDQAEEGHKPATSGSTTHSILALNQRTDGKSGFLSFYGPFRKIIKDKDFNFVSTEGKNASLIWLFGPITLVASVVLPPFFLRKLFEAYFEDSLLTGYFIPWRLIEASRLLAWPAMLCISAWMTWNDHSSHAREEATQIFLYFSLQRLCSTVALHFFFLLLTM